MTAVTPSRSGVSPSSSPRLPSPPPIPEVQYGPLSPGISDIGNELQFEASLRVDQGSARRIRPGTKAADMAIGPPLVPLSQLDSPFQLQEHLKAQYATLTHTPDSTRTIPVTKETALQLTTPPQINENETVDRNLWLYELCRFLTQKANMVSIFLMNDNPPCSSQTCPEMRASEWQYLCAVHEPPKSCCAVDYCNHTLDWAANVLTSPKHFPSRLALGGEAGNAVNSMRQLTNIFRRVYRIFAHAWFQHREVFWSVESTYGLYVFFKTVCDEYHLIPEDSYTIPPEAEGAQDHSKASDDAETKASTHVQILRKQDPPESGSDPGRDTEPFSADSQGGPAATARRHKHKHTPSTGSLVDTITEGLEEDDEQATSSSANIPPLDSVQSQLPTEGGPDRTNPVTQLSSSTLPRTEVSPERSLPKLDLSNIVPKYEPRAPEDPTPTAHEVDPMSTYDMGEPGSVQRPSTKGQGSSGTSAPSVDQISTPVKTTQDEEEENITSPSGGSIRTVGSDILQGILGHIGDEDEEVEGALQAAHREEEEAKTRRDRQKSTSPAKEEKTKNRKDKRSPNKDKKRTGSSTKKESAKPVDGLSSPSSSPSIQPTGASDQVEVAVSAIETDMDDSGGDVASIESNPGPAA
ncbi:hypothetical protein PV10_06833 [Exophiala mesophila]|uniref:Mob1/phocein n=1 Tax=Exophiala mesophila TaxID=212818 RepID=A0A0D1ZRP4_EXOME|nr:uncharacterized protein PV10_06833 [Exophiala mesophila]KIV89433.1 hypothetical protein PV10_06833 [Exophiala mesophila]